MFHATATEIFVLKTILELSKNNSIYIEENELFKIISSARNDRNFAQNDENALKTFKNALSGCLAKGFIQKTEQSENSFYKITEEGLKQI